MALRDRILNFQQVATATLATTATPYTSEAQTVATVATVSVAREGKTETPISCEGCPALELLDVAGVMVAGCVKTLPPSSPWAEEWRRIPEGLTACPDKPRQANGHGCGFCGANIYTEAPGGWRCEGCGILYKSIGGTHAPRLQIH